MSDLFEKMRAIEAEVARERGGILFFGLLKAAHLPDQWDLVIVATWVQENTLPDLRYVAEKLQSHLTSDEMVTLARTVLLAPAEATLLVRAGAFNIRPGGLEAVNLAINELVITHAYIVSANPDEHRRAVAAGAMAEEAAAPHR